MVNQKQGAPNDGESENETADKVVDPRDSDHATGSEQAADNDATESPS